MCRGRYDRSMIEGQVEGTDIAYRRLLLPLVDAGRNYGSASAAVCLNRLNVEVDERERRKRSGL